VKALVDELSGNTPLGRPVAVLAIVLGLFLVAWVTSRVCTRVAVFLIDRSERRRARGVSDTGVMAGLRQRETAISLIDTSIRYFVFSVAIVLSLATIAGAQRLQTVVGASFLALIIAFAAQRFLMDVIAGLLMFFEGWFRIGDTVAIDIWQVRGVVESASLRSLTIRSVTGEIVHIPNSSLTVLKVIPRGYREIELEFFTSELAAGRALVRQVARIVPVGATRFIRRPAIEETERLDDSLYRISARCAVAVGREWLADDFLPTLIRERAAPGLLLHGPIVTYIDEQAFRSFSRALPATRTPPTGPAAMQDDRWEDDLPPAGSA
jgi:moderate conductance mechanosensitive channel